MVLCNPRSQKSEKCPVTFGFQLLITPEPFHLQTFHDQHGRVRKWEVLRIWLPLLVHCSKAPTALHTWEVKKTQKNVERDKRKTGNQFNAKNLCCPGRAHMCTGCLSTFFSKLQKQTDWYHPHTDMWPIWRSRRKTKNWHIGGGIYWRICSF